MEYGGPYRKLPTFDGMADVQKKKMPEIDRSSLVAINSYDLGYLRDSMAELSNRQAEIEAHEAVRRHARHLAMSTGIPARDLIAGTRRLRTEQRYAMNTPRGAPSGLALTLPSTSLTGAQTIANPVGDPLDQLVADRDAAQQQREVDQAFHEMNQAAAVEPGVQQAQRRLDAFSRHGVLGHSRDAMYHLIAGAAHAVGAGTSLVQGVGESALSFSSSDSIIFPKFFMLVLFFLVSLSLLCRAGGDW